MDYRELFKLTGLDIDEAADLLKVSPRTIQRWLQENDASKLAIDRLAMYAGIFPGLVGVRVLDGSIEIDGQDYQAKHLRGLVQSNFYIEQYSQEVARLKKRMADFERVTKSANDAGAASAIDDLRWL